MKPSAGIEGSSGSCCGLGGRDVTGKMDSQ